MQSLDYVYMAYLISFSILGGISWAIFRRDQKLRRLLKDIKS